MARYGYGYVPEKGFIGFLRDLSEGAWAGVSLKKVDFPEHVAPGAQLFEAPRPVLWKLRATWAIAGVREVLGLATADTLQQLGDEWDCAQRRLFFAIAGAVEDIDRFQRESAERLRGALLQGDGTAQTNLGYDEEVDFGRQQIELASKGELATDAARIDLNEVLAQVAATTEALAQALGRGVGQRRVAGRSARLREALIACSTTFNNIHDEIAWLVAHTAAGDARQHLEQLFDPFQALLDRYPPPDFTVDATAPAPNPLTGKATAS